MSRLSTRFTEPPEFKLGWLNKRSRDGFIKNWRKRYFVLDNGVVRYFEKECDEALPPFGQILKGELVLSGASCSYPEKERKFLVHFD